MTVYFVRAEDRGRWKIGYTDGTAEGRLKGGAAFCFCRVEVVCQVPGTPEDERYVHRNLGRLRVRGVPGSEVFEDDPIIHRLAAYALGLGTVRGFFETWPGAEAQIRQLDLVASGHAAKLVEGLGLDPKETRRQAMLLAELRGLFTRTESPSADRVGTIWSTAERIVGSPKLVFKRIQAEKLYNPARFWLLRDSDQIIDSSGIQSGLAYLLKSTPEDEPFRWIQLALADRPQKRDPQDLVRGERFADVCCSVVAPPSRHDRAGAMLPISPWFLLPQRFSARLYTPADLIFATAIARFLILSKYEAVVTEGLRDLLIREARKPDARGLPLPYHRPEATT